MSNLALACTLVFVAVTVFLSIKQKLGLGKDIVIGTVRTAVQLLFIGYVLHYIFGTRNPIFIVLIILSMIGVAAWNAGSRAKQIRGLRLRIAIALACTEGLTMALLLGLSIIEPTPRYIIPISGIIIGSSMVVAGIYLNQMKRELEASRGEVETLLALGASAKQAIRGSVKRSVRSSMIPTIDSMKTVGLVQLPGMMTGMIVAGADPIEAVRYQMLIMFVLSSSAAITAMLLSRISYRLWFTNDLRLIPSIGAQR
ncbi:iron export ABC transporter permease subunit FetB [Paenibacillus sp. NEAU-GSW1]|uniref:ABC transporter permease n=1 Tax=Paenibacillus sp. NEAU-GSW1 TaxID=2682486 RepID=UPI0012E11DBD|nr:iron export ABC transporter permease subunit FetB [Paenibacillus sp. NEAU-GSW1]MUT67153.1 iron export ABC transporter permease subunit FetB [Paenibacillus sp. NEAU-GSW1]